MEDIIKAIVELEYEVAYVLIILDKLDQKDLEKLLYFCVYKLIDKKINQFIFIELVKSINKTRIDYTKIKHCKSIIEILISENYQYASEFLYLSIDIKNISKELTKFIDLIIQSKGSLRIAVKKITENDRIFSFDVLAKLYNVISESDKYIRSYNKLSSYPSNNNDNINDSNSDSEIESNQEVISKTDKTQIKYNYEYIAEHFESNCREEIINRFSLLKKYFGLYFLANVNVPIIMNTDFEQMSHNDIIKYYFDSIKKIKKSINNHIKLYHNYFRIYNRYDSIIIKLDSINYYENIIQKD